MPRANGIRYFDTAPHHGRGRSETRFGRWLAGRLTLMDRDAENGLLQACAAQGTSLVPGDIFNSAILATGPKPGVWFNYEPAPVHIIAKAQELQTRAAAVGLTFAEAAMQFALRQRAMCPVLIGTGKLHAQQRNLNVAKLELSGDALAFVTT